MQLFDIEAMCERASNHVFSKRKLFIATLSLIMVGILMIIAVSLALHANEWVGYSLAFLAAFISCSSLVPIGVIIIRAYHDEIKKGQVNYASLAAQSGKHFMTACSLFAPIVIAYVALWLILGAFSLLRAIPIIGSLFSVILAFGPFLLIFGSLCLGGLALLVLFLAAPLVALRPALGTQNMIFHVFEEISKKMFSRIVLFVLAILPFLLTFLLLWLTAHMTIVLYEVRGSTFSMILQWVFIMLPFAAILSPAVVFFFNMAAEAHVLSHRR